ncbi:MAG TPA: hypothetical protein VFJ72_09690 [Rubrobacteraceae bacterium]|nr:hypothetical protein [Rubrobacteraceae bacterium]
MPGFQVYTIDVIVLISCLAASRAIPIRPTLRKEDAKDYFLGGCNFIWPLTAFTPPFYLRSGVFTMPEFLAKRCDSRNRLPRAPTKLSKSQNTSAKPTMTDGANT